MDQLHTSTLTLYKILIITIMLMRSSNAVLQQKHQVDLNAKLKLLTSD
jgi:hypothetical protein